MHLDGPLALSLASVVAELIGDGSLAGLPVST